MPAAAGGVHTIDLEKLAERVYRLMREEIRLEQARGERAWRRGKR